MTFKERVDNQDLDEVVNQDDPGDAF